MRNAERTEVRADALLKSRHSPPPMGAAGISHFWKKAQGRTRLEMRCPACAAGSGGIRCKRVRSFIVRAVFAPLEAAIFRCKRVRQPVSVRSVRTSAPQESGVFQPNKTSEGSGSVRTFLVFGWLPFAGKWELWAASSLHFACVGQAGAEKACAPLKVLSL